MANEFDVIPVQSDDRVDQQDGVVCIGREAEPTEVDQVVGGFGGEASGRLSFEGASGFSSAGGPGSGGDGKSQEEMEKLIDRTINATIVLAAGSFAITKLLTIDHDYWHVSQLNLLVLLFLLCFTVTMITMLRPYFGVECVY